MNFYATHYKSLPLIFVHTTFERFRINCVRKLRKYLIWTQSVWQVSDFGPKHSKVSIFNTKYSTSIVFVHNHSKNIQFLYKIFAKYQIFTQNIQNFIDLAHRIQKTFDFGPTHSNIIWCWSKIFFKMNFYAWYSKIIVFVHKTFKKYIWFWHKTFEKYRMLTKNIWKVSDFCWKHSKIIGCWLKTFERLVCVHETVEMYLVLLQNIRKVSSWYPKYLKIIQFFYKWFENYRDSIQNIWKVSSFDPKHPKSIESLREIFEKYRIW